MNLYSFAIVFILFFSVNIVNAKGKGCEKLLGQLAAWESNFTQCALDNSVPVHFCLHCVKNYNALVLAYNKLITNKTCHDMYFDNDRLNIVASIHHNTVGLYEKAFCLECFIPNTSVPTTEVNNITKNITELQSCIDSTKEDPCKVCLGQYLILNKFYDELKHTHKNQICFDLEDAMNRTRILWSKTLNCCERKASLGIFAGISSVFAILPILFYCGFIISTKRSERNHIMLNPDPEVQPSTSNSATNIETNPEVPMPINRIATSTSTKPDEEKSNIKKLSSSESSDDENIVGVDKSPLNSKHSKYSKNNKNINEGINALHENTTDILYASKPNANILDL